MALSDPIDTLAYHRSRPLTQHRDLSALPLKQLTDVVKAWLADHSHETPMPEKMALEFYGLNHVVAKIAEYRMPYEPMTALECMLVDQYYTINSANAVRQLYYLLMICTREARHNKSVGKLENHCSGLGLLSLGNFFSVTGGEDGIHKKLLSTPPNCTVGQYVDAVRWAFYNCSWSSGYGGPAWGKVTDCLCNLVYGIYSPELMLDTVWTLCHNNGPIFNKPSLGTGHYSENIVRLLDMQRGGQMPAAILVDDDISQYAPAELKQMMTQARAIPGCSQDYVDFEAMEALGAVDSYPYEIQQQQEAGWGDPEIVAKKQAQLAAKLEADKKAAEEAAKQAAWEKIHMFEYMPGKKVEKIFRQPIAA